jgi:hypothetical protein
VPEFSFEICDAVMFIRSDAAGVDGIPLSFIKLLLPVLTLIFNHIFVISEFPGKWKTSVVMPIPKVSSPAKFSDYRPISLLVCLSKVFEVLMARLMMKRHICCNNLLTVFNLDFVGIIAQRPLLGLWCVGFRSWSYHILTTSQGLSGMVVLTFMRMIFRFITFVLCRTFKGVLMS